MLRKWFTIGIGVKRWLLVLLAGMSLIAIALAYGIVKLDPLALEETSRVRMGWLALLATVTGGLTLSSFAFWKLSHNLLAPYRVHQHGRVIDVVYAHSRRARGIKVVAIGGGTGLPSVLRGLKAYTSNITAVVTVADDGGSSGQLRRDMGVLPPGDIRSNIAALADDESLMTQLFQHRFDDGKLGGHAFGNLFIAALAGISGGLEPALTEVGRVLNIQGRVLPSTMADVNLVALVRRHGETRSLKIQGESRISAFGGVIEQIGLVPSDVPAYSESVRAIHEADIVVIGPGSLYTSILPNLLVPGISAALKATGAYRVYVCNVATQPGETANYDVADHVLAIEKHLGRGVFQAVLANNARPTVNAGVNTRYVPLAPPDHEVLQRYQVRYTDLTDPERPWRHDPQKLAAALLQLIEADKMGGSARPILQISQHL